MSELLTKILIGGILGLCGQSIRAVLGLKNLWNDSKDEIQTFDTLNRNDIFFQNFSSTKLTVSLLIGFVAGVLASLTIDGDLLMEKTNEGDGLDALFGMVLAGYGGTSFIEKAFGKFLD